MPTLEPKDAALRLRVDDDALSPMAVTDGLTGALLIEAIDREAAAGALNGSSASNCRTAVRKVLELSFGGAWDRTPFQPLDVDGILARFTSRQASALTPGSMHSYQSNFKRAVQIGRRGERERATVPAVTAHNPTHANASPALPSTPLAEASGSTMGANAADLDPSVASSSMENLLELAVLGEIVQEAWFGRGQLVDVMHSSVDAFGHDVVLECGQVLRHVQFKARRIASATSTYKINTRLAERPSGCVIWIGWSRRPNANRVDIEYRWLGGKPGEPLPDLGNTVAKHSKANAEGVKLERPDIRVVNLGRFERLPNVAALLDRLFGPSPSLAGQP